MKKIACPYFLYHGDWFFARVSMASAREVRRLQLQEAILFRFLTVLRKVVDIKAPAQIKLHHRNKIKGGSNMIRISFLFIIFMFLISLSYASEPVWVTVTGCVRDGTLTDDETDFGTHRVKNDGHYTLTIFEQNTKKPLDLHLYNNKFVKMAGYLLPNDYFFVNLDSIEVIGKCEEKITKLKSKYFTKPMYKGYRLDICREWGKYCGQEAADAFCRAMGYESAKTWGYENDIGASSPTIVIGTGQICNQSFCDGFSYIECWAKKASVSEGSNQSTDGINVIWIGNWNTNWGQMTLTQSGDTVTGNYTHDNGKINGKVVGNKLVGTWSEAPSYSPPQDAGDFEFTMSADGKSFSGRWRYGSSGNWHSDWNGKRTE